MRRRSPILAACAVALAFPATLAASSAGMPQSDDARVRLTSCRTGSDVLGRSLTVESTMRSLRSGDRMQMRFHLFHRPLSALRFRRVAGPGLVSWNAATPGVTRFRFRKAIQNLPAPGTYFVRVVYRWRDAAGHVVARTARTTSPCRQPDLRADLRVASVGVPRALGGGRFAYPVVVHNDGRGPSRDFAAAVTIGETPQPALGVAGLAAGERRAVELTGTRCPAGTPASVQLDPDDAVDERNERNNVRSFTCP